MPAWLARKYNECKLWSGTIDPRGYPRTKQDGQSVYAHRIAFESHWRPLRAGERVYRKCGERTCVNGYHLTTEPPKPSRRRVPSTAKLTARKARNIRKHWAKTDRPTQRELARKYKVSRSAISLVVRGITWRDASRSSTVPSPPPPARNVLPRWDPLTGILIAESLLSQQQLD